MTNGDYIRNMSDYDLADWISGILTRHGFYAWGDYRYECDKDCPLYECCNDQPSDNIEDWLKMERTTQFNSGLPSVPPTYGE